MLDHGIDILRLDFLLSLNDRLNAFLLEDAKTHFEKLELSRQILQEFSVTQHSITLFCRFDLIFFGFRVKPIVYAVENAFLCAIIVHILTFFFKTAFEANFDDGCEF